MHPRALVAELAGTFALVFLGAGAVAHGVGGIVGASLAHAFIVVGLVYAYGHLSGTHINPAVTAGILAAGRIDLRTALGYWVVQLLGGAIAGFALAFLYSGQPEAATLGATVLSEGISPMQGLVIEIILTFFLVNTILHAGVSDHAGPFAGIAIGLTLAACIFMGGPLTGASLNPARTLGPALAAGIYSDFWLYMVGPVLGGLLAAALYRGVLDRPRVEAE